MEITHGTSIVNLIELCRHSFPAQAARNSRSILPSHPDASLLTMTDLVAGQLTGSGKSSMDVGHVRSSKAHIDRHCRRLARSAVRGHVGFCLALAGWCHRGLILRG